MFTIQQTIDTVKALIKEKSVDTHYEDEFIYNLLLASSSLLLKRELKRKKKENPFLWKTICMPLCEDYNHPCKDCYKVGQIVLRSRYKIPQFLTDGNKSYIQITNLDSSKVYILREVDLAKYRKYRLVEDNKPYYTIENDYLYLYNVPNNNMKAILVKLIPVDISALADIPKCNNDGVEVGGTCLSFTEDTFLIDSHLYNELWNMVLDKLDFTTKLPEDITNNRQSDISKAII